MRLTTPRKGPSGSSSPISAAPPRIRYAVLVSVEVTSVVTDPQSSPRLCGCSPTSPWILLSLCSATPLLFLVAQLPLFLFRLPWPAKTTARSSPSRTWRLRWPRTPRSSSQALTLMARARSTGRLALANLHRNPPRQADLQEEVPLDRKGWLWLLQRHLWLGHARLDLLPRAQDQ